PTSNPEFIIGHHADNHIKLFRITAGTSSVVEIPTIIKVTQRRTVLYFFQLKELQIYHIATPIMAVM
ncbi:MAG: hypothetical protein LUG96_13610, partial [Tannerellaceae bacterium]|nr:hypothetical protein [Tannerellaceae bacterium]